jgi:polysaccharide export outer membrane protein
MNRIAALLVALSLIAPVAIAFAADQYTVGVADVLDINILQPEKMAFPATVAIDGSISVPYIGTVQVKDKTITEIQKTIQDKLADGYMKYPVVVVQLRESNSRKFFVYGEVMRPGGYPLMENTTAMRAISMAGGFTKFGSSSSVKVLRPRKDKPGYETVKVNIKAVMGGAAREDLVLQNEDVVVVSEGVF